MGLRLLKYKSVHSLRMSKYKWEPILGIETIRLKAEVTEREKRVAQEKFSAYLSRGVATTARLWTSKTLPKFFFCG